MLYLPDIVFCACILHHIWNRTTWLAVCRSRVFGINARQWTKLKSYRYGLFNN